MDYLNHVAEAKRHIRLAIQAINSELEAYPTPISGCDAQYIHLLEQRTTLGLALNAFDQDVFVASPRQLNPGDSIETR